ncbi:MAG TPA: glycosyltransferase family 4 protein [Stellaceae bacterium]
MKLALIVPGPIDQLTGGYIFARSIVEELHAHGDPISVIELDGRFPDADRVALDAAARALAALPDGAIAVLDGLGLLAFSDCLAAETHRLNLIGFIHHALADETGLTDDKRAFFQAAERRLLPLLHGAVCPSRHTADVLIEYGVDPKHIAVTPPGTAKPVPSRKCAKFGVPLRLLSVATVTPRKGHCVLIEALAGIDRDAWRLDCIGSLIRDRDYVAELRALIARHHLETNIRLLGERRPQQLPLAYDEADLFVLPSFHEGYGMAFAEALSYGLPIVATTGGAIPYTVPEGAGLLVPPGDVDALREALARAISNRTLLAKLSEGARRAGATLPDWPQAAVRWRDAVVRLAA